MKLVDLLEGPEFPWHAQRDMPRRSNQQMKATINSRMNDPEVEYLGSGASAVVSRSTSPHHMDNVERLSMDEDPAVAYLTHIYKTPALHDNPYLPKVRAVQQQGQVVSVVAERLHPYTSEKIYTSRMVEAIWELMTDDPLSEDPQERMYAIEAFIEKALLKGPTRVKDPNLIEAVTVIRQLRQATGGIIDIHDGNLMWRITGTMPQLVITDPIS